MGKGIYCPHCGTNNQASRFRCSQCRTHIRPVYETVIGIAALLAFYIIWLLFIANVLPYLAHIMSLSGAQFSLFVRIALDAGDYFTGWGVIAGLLLIGFLLWLGLFCQPQKAYGRNIVMTIVLAKAIGIMIFIVQAVHDVLPFMSAK